MSLTVQELYRSVICTAGYSFIVFKLQNYIIIPIKKKKIVNQEPRVEVVVARWCISNEFFIFYIHTFQRGSKGCGLCSSGFIFTFSNAVNPTYPFSNSIVRFHDVRFSFLLLLIFCPMRTRRRINQIKNTRRWPFFFFYNYIILFSVIIRYVENKKIHYFNNKSITHTPYVRLFFTIAPATKN